MEKNNNCDKLEEIAGRVNTNWQKLFVALQDLAEWIDDQEICPDMRRPCSDVPIFKRRKG